MRENIKAYVLSEILEKAYELIERLNETDHFSDVNSDDLEKIQGLLESANKMSHIVFHYLTLKPIITSPESARGIYFTIDSTTKIDSTAR